MITGLSQRTWFVIGVTLLLLALVAVIVVLGVLGHGHVVGSVQHLLADGGNGYTRHP